MLWKIFVLLFISGSNVCPSFASLKQTPGVSGTGSCDLLAHVDDSGGPLRLFFSVGSADSANEGSASMGIEVGGVVERAADGTPVGMEGARTSKHTRYTFDHGEFSHSCLSARAPEIPRPYGLPKQTDTSLMVTLHSFQAGMNMGQVTMNQIILDVYIFKNRGSWVGESGKKTNVTCGHVVVTTRFENWHFCGQSEYAQDGCAPKERGVSLDFLVRFTDVSNWMTISRPSEFIRLSSASYNAGVQSDLSQIFSFDTTFAKGNALVPDTTYSTARLWHQTNLDNRRGAGKITICHRTSSATTPFNLISIDENAVPAHETHGDIIPAQKTGCTPVPWYKDTEAQWTVLPPLRDPADKCTASLKSNVDKSRRSEKVSICHATNSAINPYVIIKVSSNAVSHHTAHQNNRDIIPAPETGCSPCSEAVNPSDCAQTVGCQYLSACGCIPSSCVCGDICCIAGLCSGEDVGVGAASKDACEIFSATLYREDERNEIMLLRFPSTSTRDSFIHSSRIWLGGDADSDADGISDKVEGPGDFDGDGIENMYDLDSDGDGIRDEIEGEIDTDNDLIPNFLDLDSDGDSISDAAEGHDGQGRLRDTSGDGIPDYLSTDSDRDGIPDGLEGVMDKDNDGLPNFQDLDSDNDGIPDAVEGAADQDGDNIPNYLDLDSDADSISDAEEGTDDPDGDGLGNYLDTDSDGDLILDTIEGVHDNDGDSVPNYLDLDSDDDGILDVLEGDVDWDGDSIPAFLDIDSDNDGINDSSEGTQDVDRDGTPNFLDLDSDGDEISDSQEGSLKTNTDGVPVFLDPRTQVDVVLGQDAQSRCVSRCSGSAFRLNYLNGTDFDGDGDGIANAIEGILDSDSDGLRDFEDPDSDNDGILDEIECPNGRDPKFVRCPDSDGDLIPDYLDKDSDGDGIGDADEGIQDLDQDGLPNFVDLDSDGDGMPDLSEGADHDYDRDGNVDFLDPNIACSHSFPGQSWNNLTRASAVHYVSCEDTVANGDISCPSGLFSCRAMVNRFHGEVGQFYTVHCPANCGSNRAIVYGPAKGDDSEGNTATIFLDHSSICRSAIANGVLTESRAGLVIIRLVEPVVSYPVIQFFHDTQAAESSPFTWPEWSRADEPSSIDELGNVSACCNYSTSPDHVNRTPDGGGCCAVMRYRQKWMGHFWLGVRGFEVTNHTFQSDCHTDTANGDCNLKFSCSWQDKSKYYPPIANHKDKCVDRCHEAPTRANVIVDPVQLETSLEQGSSPAEFTLVLDLQPESIVTVSIGVNPSEVIHETPSTLFFSPQNWSEPQRVLLSAVVCSPDLVSPTTSSISIETASADPLFDDLPVPQVTIHISKGGFCPPFSMPSNSVIVQTTSLQTSLRVVLAINDFCRKYYTYRNTDSALAQTFLEKCGHEDCRQIQETGCPFTDESGFCYKECGTKFCFSYPSDERCHVNIPALHGMCKELRQNTITICRATASQGILYTRLTVNLKNLVAYQNPQDIIPAPETGCPDEMMNASQHIANRCGNSVGTRCIIRCANGYGPSLQPVALLCKVADDQNLPTWNAAVPKCDECAPGFFRAPGTMSCIQCAEGPCEVGFYRGNCTNETDARCLPCSSKPPASLYTSGGIPYNMDRCRWICKPGYFLSSDECRPCSTSMCPVGKYRQACSALSNGECIPCSEILPENTKWITAGMPFSKDNCLWACNENYYWNRTLSMCVRSVVPAVILEYLNSTLISLSEQEGQTQSVAIKIKLSTQPSSPVLVHALFDPQINGTKRIFNFSEHNWATAHEFRIFALDDALHEGPHNGVMHFEVMSNDAEYHLLPTSMVTFGIVDNDCPVVRAPAHGYFFGCENSHGETCTILCDTGYQPGTTVELRCESEGSKWNRLPPACEKCMEQYYRSGTSCRPCSESACDPGQYKGRCTSESDGLCRPCEAPKPLHSMWHFECQWRCNTGYSEMNGTCSPLPVPRLIVLDPLPVLSESDVSLQPIRVRISRQPTSTVTVFAQNMDGQSNLTISTISFNPTDWLDDHYVSVSAFNDQQVEGFHNAVLRFRSFSVDSEWNNLFSNISLRIADNDCYFPRQPNNGQILACGTEYGNVCTFQCNAGFHPEGNVTSQCLVSGMWSREVPICDSCTAGFFKNGRRCVPCSSSLCGTGFFRSQCSNNADSFCLPCSASSKPANSRFVTAGQPAEADACRWACEIGYFQSGTSCEACSTSVCSHPGFYRLKCDTLGSIQDAACVPCSTLLPTNARWAPSTGEAICAWKCNIGFEEDSGACVPSMKPTIMAYVSNQSVLTESSPNQQASVSIELSRAPSSIVTINIRVSDQLFLLSPLQVSVSPANWSMSHTVSVVPIDDQDYEGDHGGLIFFEDVTSLDILYHGLDITTAVVPILDNDCPALLAPLNGTISSCSNTQGFTCTITCDRGFDPAHPIGLSCLPTGRWNSSVPRCIECADGYYLATNGRCTECSLTPCQIGSYRAPCRANANSICVPCIAKPAHSHFVSSGEPFDRDQCSWSCDDTYYRRDSTCVPCTQYSCPVGTYRTDCTADTDGACRPCNNFRPTNSYFTTQGNALSMCEWACNQGFEKRNGSACVAVQIAALMVTPIRMLTQEHPKSQPAEFNLALSRIPFANVTGWISPQSQMHMCRPATVNWSPDDYGPVSIMCNAIDDEIPEGRHKGTVLVSLTSSSDLEFDRLQTIRISIDIEEIRCPARADKSLYSVVQCNRTVGGFCHLQCRSGYQPQHRFALQCVYDRSGAPVWTGEVPSCMYCLPGHYRNASECIQCSTSPCTVGHYRSACVSPKGAECVVCTNPLPTFAYYTSAGDPFDSNSCHWNCMPGYSLNNLSFSCSRNTVPSLLVRVRSSQQQHRQDTSEDPSSSPATIEISLSQPPAQDVVIDLTWSSAQLKMSPLTSRVRFIKATWNETAKVYFYAIDDAVFEGPHSGKVSFRSSSNDAAFQDLQTSISITIADNDCPTLREPLNGGLLEYETNEGQFRFKAFCNSGYVFKSGESAISLVCNEVTGEWNQETPMCTKCASDYFNASGSCQPCTKLVCPAGQYRGPCQMNQDSTCRACTTIRPINSQFVSGGFPFDVNNCTWKCNAGYQIKVSEQGMNGSQLCKKIPGIDVRNDPMDSDADGIPNQIEGSDTVDTDHDGIPDYLDLDSDNDGISDAVEGAADQDGDNIPNYLDLDSDADSISDAEEGTDDPDGDGLGNYLDTDSDGDLILDAIEGVHDNDGDSVPNYLDLDSDGDTIFDSIEGSLDTDGDSVPNFLDLDSDGDTILDSYELDVDTDGDSIGDFLDSDSDNDSIPDAIEGVFDLDGDTIANFRDLDSDSDGIPDKVEGFVDNDNDNIPDRLDFDSDNDCLPDRIEGSPNYRVYNSFACAQDTPLSPADTDGDTLLDSFEGYTDVDGDGVPNYLDLDSDGDSIPDSIEGGSDFDGDLIPNFLDLDSDGDSISDHEEGMSDCDLDGHPNFLDLDSDGDSIPDRVECRCTSIFRPRPDDADSDGVPNYLDQDSDQDGIPDRYEGSDDDNQNGLPNYVDHNSLSTTDTMTGLIDSDQDGLPDGLEGSRDSDFDGTPDFLDEDSDGDGIDDKVEGINDVDGDGVLDYVDPIRDQQEPLTCRSPGCRRLEGVVVMDSISGLQALLLAAILLSVPCCGCFVGLFRCKKQSLCPHCKEPSDVCHACTFMVKIHSRLPITKDSALNRLVLMEFEFDVQKDICRALHLPWEQVSICAFQATHHTTCLMVHLIPQQAWRCLRKQQETFQGHRLKERNSTSSPLFNDDDQPSKVTMEDLVHNFKSQCSDPSSALMHGTTTRHIFEVVHPPLGEGMCSQCYQKKSCCSCSCVCCGERKGGCSAKCQRYCRHCFSPKSLCNSGNVDVFLDLDGECIPIGGEKWFRAALRKEISAALRIHPFQASIFALGGDHNHIHFTVHFISCRDAARLLSFPKMFVASSMDESKENSFGCSKNERFQHCVCPVRAKLVAEFEMQCNNANSRLRQGSLFSSIQSAVQWDYNRTKMACPFCRLSDDSCECVCPHCCRSLHSCSVDCMFTPQTLERADADSATTTNAAPHIDTVGSLGRGSESKLLLPSQENVLESEADSKGGRDLDENLPGWSIISAPMKPMSCPETSDKSIGKLTDGPGIFPRKGGQVSCSSMNSSSHAETHTAVADIVRVGTTSVDMTPHQLECVPLSRKPKMNLELVPLKRANVKLAPLGNSPRVHCKGDKTPILASAESDESTQQIEVQTATMKLDNNEKVMGARKREKWLARLNISKENPFVVNDSSDLVDVNGVKQGMDGYSNEIVSEGDFLLAVDGCDVQDLPVGEACRMLMGDEHSVVEITLRRRHTGSEYCIKVLRQRLQDWDDDHITQYAESCYAGLEVTTMPPHRVLKVRDLVDEHGVKQGGQGYGNPEVIPGDRILFIGGKPAENVSMPQLHGMLRGPMHSIIEIELAKGTFPHDKYKIRVLRHNFLEFDVQPSPF